MNCTPVIPLLWEFLESPERRFVGKSNEGLMFRMGRHEFTFSTFRGHPVWVELGPINFPRWGVNPALSLDEKQEQKLMQIIFEAQCRG